MGAVTIGVAGASGSGKTRLAYALAARFEAHGRSAIVVSADWFYSAPVSASIAAFAEAAGPAQTFSTLERLKLTGAFEFGTELSEIRTDLSELTALPTASLIAALETQLSVSAGTFNWDEPGALDLKGLSETIGLLRHGESAHVDEFNFATRQRDLRRELQPADVVIVEGLFVFASRDVESALDVKFFVEASEATTWMRKRARDSGAARGGYGDAYLRAQFEQAWKMSLLHVAPTKLHAGVTIVRNDADALWEPLVQRVFDEALRVSVRLQVTTTAATGGDWGAAAVRRYALVGTGSRATLYTHALASDKYPGMLVALCDTNRVRLRYHQRLLSEGFGLSVPAWHADDFGQMLVDESVECLIVCSVDCTHADYAVRALRAGCDVLVEKPLATNADDVRRILEAREAAGRSLRVGFNYRCASIRHANGRSPLAEPLGFVTPMGGVPPC